MQALLTQVYAQLLADEEVPNPLPVDLAAVTAAVLALPPGEYGLYHCEGDVEDEPPVAVQELEPTPVAAQELEPTPVAAWHEGPLTSGYGTLGTLPQGLVFSWGGSSLGQSAATLWVLRK